MRNKIFQWLWYKVFIHFTKVDKNLAVFGRHNKFMAMIKLSKLFGGATSVMFGDSEISAFDSFAVMKEYNTIVLNFGVPGTVASDWIEYLAQHPEMYGYINSLKQVVSIGGNNSLRGLMPSAKRSMELFWTFFKRSYIIIIPPVFEYILGLIGKSEEVWKVEIEAIRQLQRDIWKDRIVDCYTPFVDPKTDLPLPGVLKDIVHFSQNCAKLIQKVLDVII